MRWKTALGILLLAVMLIAPFSALAKIVPTPQSVNLGSSEIGFVSIDCDGKTVSLVLSGIDGVTPHYRIVVDNETGLDRMVVHVELKPEAFSDSFEEMDKFRKHIEKELKSVLLVASKVKLVEPGGIERSFGKTKHVQDLRK